jgi:DNA-binding response OmpR family regulator
VLACELPENSAVTNSPTASPAIVLTAIARKRWAAAVLGDSGHTIIAAPSGAMALELAHDIRPDVVVIEADLTDIPGIELCRRLRADPAIGRNVPIILLVPDKPTPGQRVNALLAGAWEFLRVPGDRDEILLKLQTCIEAKRNIDAALADGFADASSGLHNQSGLMRRARQLEALMSRMHAPMACIVLELDTDTPDPEAAGVIARVARGSDIVGELSASKLAVLAPATDGTGAVLLASRLIAAFGAWVADRSAQRGVPDASSSVRAGYDAVANVMYAPFDPAVLIARAASAVRRGAPEPGHQNVRRYAPTELLESTPLLPETISSGHRRSQERLQ